MTRVGIGAGLVVSAWAGAASAQVAAPAPDAVALGDWQLTPVVEARMRGEYRFDLDAEHRGFLVERARLGVDVERGPVEGRVVLEDARVWDLGGGDNRLWEPGPESGPLGIASGGQNFTGAHELWIEAHSASIRPVFVRVGRQPVRWGEGRLLGTSDWSPQGRSLDAIRARLPVGDGALEVLGAALPDSSGPSSLASTGELVGARAEWVYHPLFALEGYLLARFVQVRDSYPSVHGQTYTGALRLHGDAYAWTWGLEGAYQLGHADDIGVGEDRAAWAVAGHVAHTFERVLFLPTLRLGASYASGDDGGSTYRAFDPILPDVHLWHGAMDVFGWSNELEASARVAATPWTDAIAAIEYRYARLAQAGGAWKSDYLVEIGHLPSNTRADLGHEIDAVLTWSPWVALEWTAGYSLLVLGDGARAILDATVTAAGAPNLAHLAYVQGTLRLP